MKKLNLFITSFLIIAILTSCSSSAPDILYAENNAEKKSSDSGQAVDSNADIAYKAEGHANNGDAEEAPPPNVGYSDYDEYVNEVPALEAAPWSNNDYALKRDPTGSERYLPITENPEISTAQQQTLTFSLKTDTASYRNVARYIESGNRPPADAVRIEEMINYFKYEQVLTPRDFEPFAVYTELGRSPFDADKYLAYIRVAAREADTLQLPPSNITFLIDTSGSMSDYDKLPLLKSAFYLLTQTLSEDDRISIVTYAGASAVVLDGINGSREDMILEAIDGLMAAGSTAGADGINTAYKLAEKNFIKGGNNRIILATDGDFNVGASNLRELENLIAEKRATGIYLSVLGFGTGNLRDDVMETLAKNGNGNYSYIDSVSQAKKVLVDEYASNLYTIADDVKAQVEFNPALVSSYRLIGYENRMLAKGDFDDDTKDAGEIGIGTDVVVIFEVTLGNSAENENLKYQTEKPQNEWADELFEVRIRYKNSGESESCLMTHPVKLTRILEKNTSDFTFASSVACFGHILRGGVFESGTNLREVEMMASASIGKDRDGYRVEFIDLVRKAGNAR